MVLSFVLSVVVVNYFGEKVYGDYTLAFSVIELLGVFAMLGFNQFFLIHIPKVLDDDTKVSSIYFSGKKTVLLASSVFALVLFGASFLKFPYFDSENARFFFRFGALAMPLFDFGNLQSTFLNSIKLSNLSQWNEKLIKPIILIVLVILIALLGKDVEWLLYAYFLSVIVGVLLNHTFVSKHFSFKKITDYTTDVFAKKRGLTLIIIISFITLIASRTDMYMLGWISGSEYSGLYNVYFKLSGLVSIGLSSSLVIVMPLLVIYANLVGMLGGALVATTMDVSFSQYIMQIQKSVNWIHISAGLIKSVFFGLLIAVAGCQAGLHCGRNSDAVGMAATNAVVRSIVYLVVADAAFNILYFKMGI
jgi:O-antigen/teichoic acid export membrane protein